MCFNGLEEKEAVKECGQEIEVWQFLSQFAVQERKQFRTWRVHILKSVDSTCNNDRVKLKHTVHTYNHSKKKKKTAHTQSPFRFFIKSCECFYCEMQLYFIATTLFYNFF